MILVLVTTCCLKAKSFCMRKNHFNLPTRTRNNIVTSYYYICCIYLFSEYKITGWSSFYKSQVCRCLKISVRTAGEFRHTHFGKINFTFSFQTTRFLPTTFLNKTVFRRHQRCQYRNIFGLCTDNSRYAVGVEYYSHL